jgi:translin
MLRSETVAGLRSVLEAKARLLEGTLSSSRRIIILSKQAVVAIHRKELDEAAVKLTEAGSLLRILNENLNKSPEFVFGATRTAYQEYAEARILLAYVEGKSLPSPEELAVPIIPYVLGFADAVGEFRRAVLEALRRGDLSGAERCLQTMEEVYDILIQFEEFYTLMQDLRRKVDVARRLIELTLGDIAYESRRVSLEKALRSLESRLEVGRLET